MSNEQTPDLSLYLVLMLFVVKEITERGEEINLTPVSLAKNEKIKY